MGWIWLHPSFLTDYIIYFLVLWGFDPFFRAMPVPSTPEFEIPICMRMFSSKPDLQIISLERPAFTRSAPHWVDKFPHLGLPL